MNPVKVAALGVLAFVVAGFINGRLGDSNDQELILRRLGCG